MAQTANQQITDAFIRHQIYMLRYAGGLRNKYAKLLAKTDPKLYKLILAALADLDGTRTLNDQKSIKVMSDLQKEIEELRKPTWLVIQSEAIDELSDFAVAEAGMAASTIQSAVPVVLGLAVPPTQKLISVVKSQPFQGKTLKEWVAKNSADDIQRILDYAKVGITQGRTPKQIAREIVAGSATAPDISKKAVKDLESVLLTVTNGVQQQVKQDLYEANSDIINEEAYLATLDSRTTFVCASEDGKTYPRGKGPIPPLHFRCRSLRVPYINPDNLGDRPFYAGVEKDLLAEFTASNKLNSVNSRAELPRGYKTSYDQFLRKRRKDLIGNVPARTTFNEFLKRQSNSFQDNYLGPARAKAFREGKFSLDRAVDATGKTLTLEQLKLTE